MSALNNLFQGIADAIRSKDGTTASISARTFPERIRAISSGSSGPFYQTSMESQDPSVINVPVNISVETSVSAPSGILYYYNHEQLAEIPAEVLAEYPYVIVLRQLDGTWRLYAAKTKFYLKTNTDGIFMLILPASERCRYDYHAIANSWYFANTQDGAISGLYLQGDSQWTIWWSNFDVPNGSADATEIHFPASEPKSEKPADATHYYYNGVLLPEIPAMEGYPYAIFFKQGDVYKFWLCGGKIQYNSTGNYLTQSSGSVVEYNYSESDGWIYKSTGNYASYFDQIIWSNHDVPNGSPTSTNIYYYGTLAVPDPE